MKIRGLTYYLKYNSINLSNRTIDSGFSLKPSLFLVILNNDIAKVPFPFSQGRSNKLPPPLFIGDLFLLSWSM